MDILAGPLAESHTVIMPDLVGHGCSPAPELLSNYYAEAQVEHLRQVVSDCCVTGVSVVGYSMGARLALTFAIKAPGLVERLVLIGGSPGLLSLGDVSERLQADRELALSIERGGMPPFVDYWEQLPLFETQKRLAPIVRAQIRAVRLQQRTRGIANSLRGFGLGTMPPVWDELGSVNIPTLVMAGALDLKYVKTAEEMAKLMPAAETAVFADVGHAVHLEAPGSSLALMLEHFAS